MALQVASVWGQRLETMWKDRELEQRAPILPKFEVLPRTPSNPRFFLSLVYHFFGGEIFVLPFLGLFGGSENGFREPCMGSSGCVVLGQSHEF